MDYCEPKMIEVRADELQDGDVWCSASGVLWTLHDVNRVADRVSANGVRVGRTAGAAVLTWMACKPVAVLA